MATEATEAAAGLQGPFFGPVAGGAPKQIVVMCHGLGANGHQLIQYAPHAAEALPHTLFVAPNGPEAAPGGMRRWFQVDGQDEHQLLEGLRRGSAALDRFVDAELARYNLPGTACALVGFSQGAMVVLHAGLRRREAPFGIAALSGGLFDHETLDKQTRNTGPVLLAHGEADDWVPVEWSRIAATALRERGIEVETYYAPGLGHHVNGDILLRLLHFLQAHAPD